MSNLKDTKKTIQLALDSEYGFKPSLDKIFILSNVTKEGRTINAIFTVKDKLYKFNSYILHIGNVATVWCGSGTITKIK